MLLQQVKIKTTRYPSRKPLNYFPVLDLIANYQRDTPHYYNLHIKPGRKQPAIIQLD